MKKLFIIPIVCLILTSCWNPSVKEVPITGDWRNMELPIQSGARVWACDATQLKIVHKASREAVAEKYLENFETHGWTLTKTENWESQNNYRFAKGNVVLSVEIYDFEKTGVIIKKIG